MILTPRIKEWLKKKLNRKLDFGDMKEIVYELMRNHGVSRSRAWVWVKRFRKKYLVVRKQD